ncbi:hypothetical protein GB937_005691 [Aspergillus fischeri]|nr:hypothetical protein GB937_005691 [Aspergillus fischeri]
MFRKCFLIGFDSNTNFASPTDENPIGIPYILMSKASGVPLSKYDWTEHRMHPNMCGDSERTLMLSQKRKVMEQLGGIHAHMSNLWFDHISLLCTENRDYNIGKCLFPSLLLQGRDEFNDDEIPRGPFTTSGAFYAALICAFFTHVKELPMEHHLFRGPVPILQEYESYEDYKIATDRWNDYVAVGSKTENMRNCLDYALVGVSLTDWVPLLAGNDSQFKCVDFPLYHPDLSSQNIFMDDNFNITCIIDWAFASSIPPSMLLVCPGLPHPHDNIQPFLKESFAKGFVTGHGFNGQSDLDFSHSSIYWAFLRLVSLDSLQDYLHFSKLFKKISSFLGEDETGPGEFTEDESQYFSCVGPERQALSRYLTMVTEMNPTFVADMRLWKCITAYLNERESFMYLRDQERTPSRKRKLDYCV